MIHLNIHNLTTSSFTTLRHHQSQLYNISMAMAKDDPKARLLLDKKAIDKDAQKYQE